MHQLRGNALPCRHLEGQFCADGGRWSIVSSWFLCASCSAVAGCLAQVAGGLRQVAGLLVTCRAVAGQMLQLAWCSTTAGTVGEQVESTRCTAAAKAGCHMVLLTTRGFPVKHAPLRHYRLPRARACTPQQTQQRLPHTQARTHTLSPDASFRHDSPRQLNRPGAGNTAVALRTRCRCCGCRRTRGPECRAW